MELDDGYLGGQRSGGKLGRGSKNKIPFVTAVQTTESGEAQLVCQAQVPFTNHAMTAFVNKCLVRPLTVISDGLACFTVTAKAGVHERIVVSAGDPGAAYARFNAVSTAQCALKTAISGASHSINFANFAHRCLAEFQLRFNRRFDMRAIFARLARAACASQRANRSLIRAAQLE